MDLQAIRERWAQATPGPWVWDEYDDLFGDGFNTRILWGGGDWSACTAPNDADAYVIREARTLVPMLLDEIERLRGQVKELEGRVRKDTEYDFRGWWDE